MLVQRLPGADTQAEAALVPTALVAAACATNAGCTRMVGQVTAVVTGRLHTCDSAPTTDHEGTLALLVIPWVEVIADPWRRSQQTRPAAPGRGARLEELLARQEVSEHRHTTRVPVGRRPNPPNLELTLPIPAHVRSFSNTSPGTSTAHPRAIDGRSAVELHADGPVDDLLAEIAHVEERASRLR